MKGYVQEHNRRMSLFDSCYPWPSHTHTNRQYDGKYLKNFDCCETMEHTVQWYDLLDDLFSSFLSVFILVLLVRAIRIGYGATKMLK